jgi:predicted O-linked N-acetylglucosamine transferase (SPINDLY family)
MTDMGRVDIALDPFPYQGTYTTLETLSMSVPVISLAGETYSRRATSALLWRLGLDELVAASAAEYVGIALSLARDHARRASIRGVLRERFLHSEICDVAAYVGELELHYREAWREWCATGSCGDAQPLAAGS